MLCSAGASTRTKWVGGAHSKPVGLRLPLNEPARDKPPRGIIERLAGGRVETRQLIENGHGAHKLRWSVDTQQGQGGLERRADTVVVFLTVCTRLLERLSMANNQLT